MIINLSSLSLAAREWLNSLGPINAQKKPIDNLQMEESLLLAKIKGWLQPKNVTAWKKTEFAHLIEVANLSLLVAQAVSTEIYERVVKPGSGNKSITNFLLQIKPANQVQVKSSDDRKAAEKVFISALLTYEFEYQKSYAQHFAQAEGSATVKIAIRERNVAQQEYDIAREKKAIEQAAAQLRELDKEQIVMDDSTTAASSLTPRAMTMPEARLWVRRLIVEANEIDVATEKQKIALAKSEIEKINQDTDASLTDRKGKGRVMFSQDVVGAASVNEDKLKNQQQNNGSVSAMGSNLELAQRHLKAMMEEAFDIFSPLDSNHGLQISHQVNIAKIEFYLDASANGDPVLHRVKSHGETVANEIVIASITEHLTGEDLLAMLTLGQSYGEEVSRIMHEKIFALLLGDNKNKKITAAHLVQAMQLLAIDCSQNKKSQQMLTQLQQRLLPRIGSQRGHDYSEEKLSADQKGIIRLVLESKWALLQNKVTPASLFTFNSNAESGNNNSSSMLSTPPSSKQAPRFQTPGSGGGLSSAGSNTSSAKLDQISPAGSTTSSANLATHNNNNITPQSNLTSNGGTPNSLFPDDDDDDSLNLLGSNPSGGILSTQAATDAKKEQKEKIVRGNLFGKDDDDDIFNQSFAHTNEQFRTSSSVSQISITSPGGLSGTVTGNNNNSNNAANDTAVVNNNSGSRSPTFKNSGNNSDSD